MINDEDFVENIWDNDKKETHINVTTANMLLPNEIKVKDEPPEDYKYISTLDISDTMINKREEIREFPGKRELDTDEYDNQNISLNTVEGKCEDTEEFAGKVEDDKCPMEIGEYKISWRNEMEDFIKKEADQADYMGCNELDNETHEDVATDNCGGHITEQVNKNTPSVERPFECSLCSKRFKLHHHLKTHDLTHRKEKKFHCTRCDYKSNYKIHLMKHFQNKHTRGGEDDQPGQPQLKHLKAGLILFFPNPDTGEKRYKCLKCEYKTNSLYDINRHLSVHNDTRAYECEMCKKRFKRPQYLKYHRLTHFRKDRYKCSKCEYKTNSTYDINRHLSVHNNMRAYECEMCEKRFKRLQYLKQHQLTHFREKKYHCMHCDYKTNYKTCIVSHLGSRCCRDDGVYKCSECDYRGFSNNDLSNHLITHFNQSLEQSTAKDDLNLRLTNSNEEKKLKCSKCNYETKYKRYLDKHLLVHSNVRAHECSVCNKRFKQPAHLKNHEVVHLKPVDIDCIHCDYKTNSKECLVRHLKNKHPGQDKTNVTLDSKNTDMDRKKHKCSKCGYQTNRKSYLTKHLLVHNNLRPFECEDCGKRFKSSYELKMHSFVHSGEKKFQCPYCDYKCIKNYYLRIHLKDKHSENEEKEYKCSECQYQTNFSGNFKTHIQKHLRNA